MNSQSININIKQTGDKFNYLIEELRSLG